MLVFMGLGGYELILILLAALLFLSLLVLPVIALVDILRSQFEDPNNKLIWVLIVLFLNVAGAILYYAIGRKQRVA